MTKTKKLKKSELLIDNIGYLDLEDILEKVQEIKEKYPYLTDRDFSFHTTMDYDCPICELEFYRDETDEEADKRINADKYRKQDQEKRERQQYELLKKKYG